MRLLILSSLIFFLSSGIGVACDDHVGTCEIEDWRYHHTPIMNALTIEGTTTCDKGMAKIRLYEKAGEKPKFLGVTNGYIRGHAFQAVVMNIDKKPSDLLIKYSMTTVH